MDYYNEHDPFAAAWLRELIKAGEIPDGHVDERDIQDVQPSDLVGYRHCHFFAGIGGWAYALRLADWPDDQPIWTGSCPCQPFSAAGQGAGFADERHLWPAFFWLISQCCPRYVCGEQVASGDALRWWDLVATDLEGAGYACTAVDLPAASVGAPHKRSRLFWLADAGSRESQRSGTRRNEGQLANGHTMGDSDVEGLSRRVWPRDTYAAERHAESQRASLDSDAGLFSVDDSVCGRHEDADRVNGWTSATDRQREASVVRTSSQTDGAWSDCDWLPCSDGKTRAIESGSFPLAHGVSARMGRLRGYGNAIIPQAAAEVLKAWQAVMR